ncbi:MAG: WG repeat-containing protein [Clostridia bacterium]|nr:WG repeat-containing protein [Clostridia bacterium]
MKRLMLVWVMILSLIPVLSLAERPLASRELFPAEGENGKWGYVDREGTFVIQPVFDHAFGFRGNYAEVVVFPSDDAVNLLSGDRDPYHSGYSGIIDRSGEFVLEPIYTIDAGYDEMFFGGRDTGIWCVSAGRADEENRLEGWFDIESGYFSGLAWDGVYGWISDDRLIPVADETFRSGYADRRTGELVIPCRYQPVDPSPFYGGIASVSLVMESVDEYGNPDVSSYFLIDETGTEIPLPEGIFAVPYEGAHDGLILVANQADASTFVPDEGVLFGYADVHGNIMIEPQFISARHFSDGMSAVQFREGDWGFIDPMGLVLERGLPDEPGKYEYRDELGHDMDEDNKDEEDEGSRND